MNTTDKRIYAHTCAGVKKNTPAFLHVMDISTVVGTLRTTATSSYNNNDNNNSSSQANHTSSNSGNEPFCFTCGFDFGHIADGIPNSTMGLLLVILFFLVICSPCIVMSGCYLCDKKKNRKKLNKKNMASYNKVGETDEDENEDDESERL